jgi:hypothetical protein
MNKVLYKANGRNGSVELYQNRIIIKKKFGGLKRLLSSGGKEIFLSNIKNLNYKSANAMTWGFIQFETPQNSKKLSKGSLLASPMDDFSINFSRKQQPQFDKLKAGIYDLRNRNKKPTIVQNPISDADELEKLAKLKEKGILTQEEFDFKKKQILGL